MRKRNRHSAAISGIESGIRTARALTARLDPESVGHVDDPEVRRIIRENLTAHEALEMAEGMSDGEQAQLQIAADILGLDYGDFIDKYAKEHFASLKAQGKTSGEKKG